MAEVDPKYIFTNERPQLIDEWQVVPQIWDPKSGIFIVPITALRP